MNTTFWRVYKMIYRRKAEEIEALLRCSLDDASNRDVREILGSIRRLTYRYECPVSRLKETFFASLSNSAEWDPTLLKVILYSRERIEAPKEAKEFKIKFEHTGAFLTCCWIRDRLEEIERNEASRRHLDEEFFKLTGKTGEQLLEEYNNTADSPLAPSLSKGNNLENKLFKIAQDLVNYIEYYYKPMSDEGRSEACIYCCIQLIKFRPDHGNDICLTNLCDRVFLLLLDNIIPERLDYDDFYRLFNQRTCCWSNPEWPMASLWTSFYDKPFAELNAAAPITTSISDAELKEFEEVLLSMKVRIIGKHGDFREISDSTALASPEYLKQFGLTQLAVNNLIGAPEPEPKPLIIGKDYSISFLYEDNYKIDIKLSPIEKAVYLLYLNHPEGIAFKDLGDHRAELADLYKKISRRNNEEGIEKTISRLVDPFNNSINEKCARIKAAIDNSVPEELAHWYVISGEKGEERRICLPLKCIQSSN